MAHSASTNSLELSGDTKLFDRVARKWNVDYAFYQTEPGKYLLFFKSGQADAMTACFSEYSRKVLDKKSPLQKRSGHKTKNLLFSKQAFIKNTQRTRLVEISGIEPLTS